MAGAADDVKVSTAGGEENIAADIVGGVKLQRIKAVHGIDGVNDGDVARTNPLPVQTYLETNTMHAGAAQLTPTLTVLNVTVDAELVAAVATKKIRVLALYLNVTTAGTLQLKRGGSSGTNLGGVLKLADSSSLVLPFNPVGWFESASGENIYADITTITVLAGFIVTVPV